MSCSSCFTGGTTTSKPTGTTSTIHGLPTYIASPPVGTAPKGLIVLITDAFGWEFVNNRVLADRYADRGGYLVYVPDFMNGKAMSPTALQLMDSLTTPSPSWLSAVIYKPLWTIQLLRLAIPWKSACDPAKTHAGVLSFFQALRSSAYPPSSSPTSATAQASSHLPFKIGIAAFCWGGKHAFMLANNHEPLVDCLFTAHPSYLRIPTDVQNIRIPTSVIVGAADSVLKQPQAEEMKRILERTEDCEMVILEGDGARHGFAIRTHPDDESEVECAMRAEEQALRWFGRWLGGSEDAGKTNGSVPGAED